MTVIQRKRLGHGTVAITDLVDGRSTYERWINAHSASVPLGDHHRSWLIESTKLGSTFFRAVSADWNLRRFQWIVKRR